ncbi:prepilin-type N-terminal cleavage/methylation domain-containing protein [Acinetobacter vivianii]|uniref:prepilin-type N-terminal cleavage/methylation domain-containing protein n=1 Tax=Acinetobacter vivianii TaxID=1776742 RepID=UPI003D002FA4
MEKGFTLIELMIVVTIIAILAAIAIPIFHESYVTKTKISEGLTIANTYKLAIVETFNSRGPHAMVNCINVNSCSSMGITYFSGNKNIEKIESSASGIITIFYSTAVVPANANALILVPQTYVAGVFTDLDLSNIANTDTKFQWVCRPAVTNPIDIRLLPRQCKS